ncbi:hypothetical protein JY651_10960 [Pyxidicoccus parkwayensis]|uniref:Uncharacterized protein n=1 Tax=Pyxidicoccus parkwayensis TaxID=2813578 RepID=A0ABX7P4I7_9BACT|nr:hypothetical protein [Pyxidicoccus parkwaysis]QSQ25405.1 hypothetical protein JY651_10960 [Pyxidicoccus parkwaysis]
MGFRELQSSGRARALRELPGRLEDITADQKMAPRPESASKTPEALEVVEESSGISVLDVLGRQGGGGTQTRAAAP